MQGARPRHVTKRRYADNDALRSPSPPRHLSRKTDENGLSTANYDYYIDYRNAAAIFRVWGRKRNL